MPLPPLKKVTPPGRLLQQIRYALQVHHHAACVHLGPPPCNQLTAKDTDIEKAFHVTLLQKFKVK